VLLNPFCESFLLWIFLDRFLLYAQACLDHNSPIYASPCSWEWQAYTTVHGHLLKLIFFGSTGCELRASHLLGRCSTTWAPPPALAIGWKAGVVSLTFSTGWPWFTIFLILFSE
jgi:hypothetical protein